MIIPLGHRILVKPEKLDESDEVYASAKKAGIQLLEASARQEQIAVDKGTVLALGSTAFKDFGDHPWCKVGDKIAYTRYGGKLLKDPENGLEYIILNDEDAIAKYSSEEQE